MNVRSSHRASRCDSANATYPRPVGSRGKCTIPSNMTTDLRLKGRKLSEMTKERTPGFSALPQRLLRAWLEYVHPIPALFVGATPELPKPLGCVGIARSESVVHGKLVPNPFSIFGLSKDGICNQKVSIALAIGFERHHLPHL